MLVIYSFYFCPFQNYDPRLELSPRVGTEVDRDKLAEVLTLLGFQVQVHNDLPFEKIKHAIEIGLTHSDITSGVIFEVNTVWGFNS